MKGGGDKVETLILVRHGAYGRDDRLSSRGRDQMLDLADQLLPIVAGGAVVVLSSTADRAVDSAEIICEVLGDVSFTQNKVLWSENMHPQDLPAALELVRANSDGVDHMILVTHYEYALMFPEHFGREELGVEFPREEIEKGQAWLIDCEAKTCVLVG